MMTFSLFIVLFSTYLVFSQQVHTDILMKHVLSFSAIAAAAFLYTLSMNAFITAWFLFMVAGIYWTVSEIMGVLEKIKS